MWPLNNCTDTVPVTVSYELTDLGRSLHRMMRGLKAWAEALSGTTENEEDVKIEHTKEGQQWWFYLTVLVVPLSVVLLGALRLRLRHRGPRPPKASATEGGAA